MSFETKDYGKKFALGLMRDPEKHAKLKAEAPKFELFTDTVLPGKLDLSSKVSPPEDQGQCGSCWDFGITKALRSAWMLAGKDPGRLAFNYLLNNCGPGPSQWGCNGGDFDAGQSMLGGRGPWLESEDPYRESEGSCRTGLSVAATALKWTVVGPGNRPPTFQELAAALASNRMLCIDVAVQGSWGSYSGGIYNGDGSGINHIINMVGYNMQTSVDKDGNALFNAQGQPVNGDGFLIVMNNWNTTWGENGYMRTRWGKNQIAETAMFFEVDAPPPAPPVPPTPPVPPVPPTPPLPPLPPAPVDSDKLFHYALLAITGLTLIGVGVLVVLHLKKD